MADPKQSELLLVQGVAAWNKWRQGNPAAVINLSNARLSETRLPWAQGTPPQADLHSANLMNANLEGAIVKGANLRDAVLRDANLRGANLRRSDLSGADLTRATLNGTNLTLANLRGATLAGAHFWETVLARVDLGGAFGLESCRHGGPSVIDHRTLRKSGELPRSFLRGIGLPDELIDFYHTLARTPIQFYSCFISYSARDTQFADRLHSDLQNRGVRCWFAPHDMPIAADIWDTIDEARRLRDRVLLILSENSVQSTWVEDEAKTAYAEERVRGHRILFPVRIDDSVFQHKDPWLSKIRENRNIGDFTGWQDAARYDAALQRLVRDLRTERTGTNDDQKRTNRDGV